MNLTAKLLNDKDTPTLGCAKFWGQTSVRHLLLNKATYAELSSNTLSCEGFYPAVITKNKFIAARNMV